MLNSIEGRSVIVTGASKGIGVALGAFPQLTLRGIYTFTATATDAAGNVSVLSNSIDPLVGVTGTDHSPV